MASFVTMRKGELGLTKETDGFTVGRHIGLQFYCGVTTFVVEFFGWISVGLFRLFIQKREKQTINLKDSYVSPLS